MAFCNNLKPDKSPGPINGNPLNGLCERVCIQAKKVFDACISQATQENLTVTLADFTPENPTYPLTFVSAASTSSVGTVSDVSIESIPNCAACKRCRCNVTVPVEVIYVDADGNEGKGTAEVTYVRDVLMNVPENSVFPVEIAATVNMVAPVGAYVADLNPAQFTLTACVTILLKVEAEVELLIPSYGYCYIPPCQEYSQEVCTGVFDLPLFPSTNGPGCNL